MAGFFRNPFQRAAALRRPDTADRNARGAAHTGVFALPDETIPFTVTRSKRRRRGVALDIHPEKGILRIMAPQRMSLDSIQEILRRNAGWIGRRLADLKNTPHGGIKRRFTDGETILYLGHRYRLRVLREGDASSCMIAPRRINVRIPQDNQTSPESLRQDVRLEILLWMKRRARVKLHKRLDLWADKLGVRYRRLILSDPDRRWGSCNAQNVIRLNWRLIMAPLPLIDYVAAHELCHVTHKNHSPRFWRQLASVMPDYRERRAQLRRTGLGYIL